MWIVVGIITALVVGVVIGVGITTMVVASAIRRRMW